MAEPNVYFGGDFGKACFWPIQFVFVVGEPLCDVGTPSLARIMLLRVIQAMTVVLRPQNGPPESNNDDSKVTDTHKKTS